MSIIEEKAKILFASRLLNEKVGKIYNLQSAVVDKWNLFDRGELKRATAGGRNFTISNDDNSANASLRYLAYTRFLDMADPRRSKMREGYHLYNRILYGILYNEIIPGLRYGYLDQVRDQMKAEIKAAMEAGYIDND